MCGRPSLASPLAHNAPPNEPIDTHRPSMMKRTLLASSFTLLTFLVLAACSAAPPFLTPNPTPTTAVTLPTAPPSPTPGPSATPFRPQPSPTPTPPTPSPTASPTPAGFQAQWPAVRPVYELVVDFDYARHTLAVSETIRYPNTTGLALDEIVLVVDPNVQAGRFTLKSLSLEDGQPLPDFTLEQNRLTIPLPESLQPAETLALHLTYDLQLAFRSGGIGYTEREAILMDWYPFVPPYRPGEDWLVNRAWPYGEYLAYEIADIQVEIHLTGTYAGTTPGEEGGLVLAASAPAEPVENGVRYHLEGDRAFAWSASPYYRVTTTEAAGITLQAFTFPGHEAAGTWAQQVARQALDLYSELFGAYPRSYLAVVEAGFADGREYDGLIFVSQGYYAEYDGSARNFLTLLVAHEVAHQWWYGVVGNDQAQEPWLDEALATYSEALFYQRYHPELVNWWWVFRVTYFNPQGWVNHSLYDFGGFFPYVHAVYLRGALFLRDLRSMMGDQAFFAFVRDYAVHNAYRQATAGDFFTTLEQHSQADLRTLVEQYFDPARLPGK